MAAELQGSLRKPPPATIVIFGASGDLTGRKLIPAVHSLACEGFLPDESRIVGVARSEMSDAEFQSHIFEGVQSYARLKPQICSFWPNFQDRITYLRGSYDDPETYDRLGKMLKPDNTLFYLATPPHLYTEIVDQLDPGLAE